ncbi:MAG: aminoglycoside phosphotransferase [Hyphomicrobiales bacterium]|nr:aminoglycoside phosphotransferase [Hyphomicrobiales bacterium]
MEDDPQHETIAFLNAICAQAGDESPPVSTHISRIFFAGDTVYKLKRAVRTPYLDYSSPELRLKACEQELRLNRRTAPALYRAVRRIARRDAGLSLDGEGALVDAVVEMGRFDEDCLLDRMAQAGALTPAHMEALAGEIASLHAGAQTSAQHGGAQGAAAVLALNEAALAQTFLAHEAGADALRGALRATLAKYAGLLDARRAAGKVRRCHGDLTLRNICLIDGAPTPFDCLEFDEALATTDVLYDVAFPVMDLLHRRNGDLANALFNRYLDRADEIDGLPLMPLFIAMRAVVRAHVTAAMAQDANGDARASLEDEARAYLELARAAMQEAKPRLVGVGGLSGSGKSTLAGALAPLIPPMPGARVLSSDRVRKRLHGAGMLQRLPPEAYAPQMSERVYASVREEAGRCLDAGWPVVADAVFDREADRLALEAVASQRRAPFAGYWLDAPAGILESRVAARVNDPSDANVAVLQAQAARLREAREPMGWTSLDAALPAAANAEAVATHLKRP